MQEASNHFSSLQAAPTTPPELQQSVLCSTSHTPSSTLRLQGIDEVHAHEGASGLLDQGISTRGSRGSPASSSALHQHGVQASLSSSSGLTDRGSHFRLQQKLPTTGAKQELGVMVRTVTVRYDPSPGHLSGPGLAWFSYCVDLSTPDWAHASQAGSLCLTLDFHLFAFTWSLCMSKKLLCPYLSGGAPPCQGPQALSRLFSCHHCTHMSCHLSSSIVVIPPPTPPHTRSSAQ